MKSIPYGRQYVDKSDVRAVDDVLMSDWLTQGAKVPEFEKVLSGYCGSKYAVVVSSGTAALHLAVLAAGIKKGDEVITTGITFLATPNSAIYAGAKPVFADIGYSTVNIDPEEIEKAISIRTKAIMPVHFAGLPCDMEKIYSISKKKKVAVIEDGCHALGAEYRYGNKWYKVGCSKHSLATVFSFHPVKHITTGEGGAITTNDRSLYLKLCSLRAHGAVKTPGMARKYGPWHYEMTDLGYNYRLTDFQCALGISQMKKLKGFLKKRKNIARIYDEAFSSIEGIETTDIPANSRHAYHLYLLKIDFEKIGITRKDFVLELKKKGVLSQVHYIPVYRQPYYKRAFDYRPSKYPNSEKYYQRALSLPMYPGMSDGEVKKVVRSVKEIIDAER